MRLVSTEMLNERMVLAKNVYSGNCLIIKAGSDNIYKYAANLQNMGIRYIYVEDDNSKNIEIPDAITEETRVACKRILMNTIGEFTQDNSLRLVRLTEAVEQVISDIMQKKDVQISLMDISSADEYTFSHCVSTTVYALLIGRQLGYSRKKLEHLAIGTLLHDLGKILLDSRIMFKADFLTSTEFEYVKLHASVGYEAIKGCSNVSRLSKDIILNHHEKLDGSGYPRGIKEKQIDEFSKIAAIADVYDALTSDRCYRKKWSTNKALDYLMANSESMFDAELVRIFMQQVAIYPNGSMVRLSDGSIALVKEQNPSIPLRPVVRVYADKNGRRVPLKEIDLMKILSLTITESELEIQNSTLETERKQADCKRAALRSQASL